MSSSSFEIATDAKPIPCLQYGASPVQLVFTHGAGGTLTSDAMVHFASGFATVSPVLCFQGSMNLASRVKAFRSVLDHTRGKDCGALGGRSMGARAAVMAADESTGFLVLVSYPLRSEKGEVRSQILLEIGAETEVLFISGDGDGMCDLDELDAVRRTMRCKSWLVRVRGADHGMNVRPKKGTEAVGVETGRIAAEWLRERVLGRTECEVSFGGEGGASAVRTRWEGLEGVAGGASNGVKADADEPELRPKTKVGESILRKAPTSKRSREEVDAPQSRKKTATSSSEKPPATKRSREDVQESGLRRSSRLRKG